MRVKKLTIKIDQFGDAAMVDNRNAETSTILRQLADRIEEYGIPNQDGLYLMDSNGIQVGSVKVKYRD